MNVLIFKKKLISITSFLIIFTFEISLHFEFKKSLLFFINVDNITFISFFSINVIIFFFINIIIIIIIKFFVKYNTLNNFDFNVIISINFLYLRYQFDKFLFNSYIRNSLS